jgi:hypothetical protein
MITVPSRDSRIAVTGCMMHPTVHALGGHMHTRTIAATALSAALLTGCSSGSDTTNVPSLDTTTTAAAGSARQIIQRCADAIAERGAAARAAAARSGAARSGAVRSEPRPKACVQLSDSDYLDAYLAGLRQVNQAGQDEPRDDETDKAADGTG